MKKVATIVILAVFTSISGRAKANVDFMVSSPSTGVVTIGYTATANEGVRGIALSVSLSHNATAVYTDIISIEPAFDVFLEYAATYGIDAIEAGDGHPFADPSAPGVIEQPASSFSIVMGYLDDIGGAGPTEVENLITFRIQDGGAGFSNITIQEDALRDGIVGDNITTVTFPESLYVTVPEPATLSLLAIGGLALRRKR